MIKKGAGFLAVLLVLSIVFPLGAVASVFDNDIPYDDLMRYPEKYENREVYFSGKAVTVKDLEDGRQALLLEVRNKKVVIVDYDPVENLGGRVLEKDKIEVYGIFTGLGDYDEVSTKGKKKGKTAPRITGKILAVNKNAVNIDYDIHVWKNKSSNLLASVFKNRGSKEAYVLCGVVFMDRKGDILDYQISKVGPIAPGQEALYYWDTYHENWYMARCSPLGVKAEDGKKGIQKDLKYKTSLKKTTLTVEITNKGKSALRNVNHTVAFFKKGDLVFIREGQLNDGKSFAKGEKAEMDFEVTPSVFDKVKVYFTQKE